MIIVSRASSSELASIVMMLLVLLETTMFNINLTCHAVSIYVFKSWKWDSIANMGPNTIGAQIGTL